MTGGDRRLDDLQAWLASTHGSILNSALAIDKPAGISPEWRAVLDAFGVEPISDREREETARMSTMTRGAPVMEVQRVLERLERNASAALEKIGWPDDPAGSRQWDKLRTLTVNLVQDSLAAYKAKVLAKRSMFAMARAAMQKPAAPESLQAAMTVILTCSNCGAPRLTEEKFECVYCGTSFKEQR